MLLVLMQCLANCDSSVHISEESSNAATAVPWAIVSRESHIHGANTKCIRSVPLASQDSSGGVSIHIHLLKAAQPLIAIGGMLILSIVWYYFPVYGGVHWFTGPVPNIGKLGEESPSSRESVEEMERVDVKEMSVDA
jgi:hypothetical protein